MPSVAETPRPSRKAASIRWASRSSWFALVLLASAPIAHAQPRDRDPDLRRAVLLFEESEELYNRGDFEEAAMLLRRAYELHPDPTLVYNLGRSLEAMGDLDGAIEAYERYLREAPDAEDRGEVGAQLATLRDRRDRLATEALPDPPARAEEPPTVEPSERGLSPWPFVILGGGVALAGAGAIVGLVGAGVHDEAKVEPVQVEVMRLQDQADGLATIANVLFIAGGVALVAGVVVLVVDLTSGDDAIEDAANGIVARF
jgi:tetratricopeptide (TPR) repeat protein